VPVTSQPFDLAIFGLNYAPEPTGNAPYTASLARGLAARGHGVTVTAAHPHYPAWEVSEGYGQWSLRTVEEGVRVRRLRHYIPREPRGLARLLSEASFGLRLLVARRLPADVSLLVSPALFSSALALLSPRRRPCVLWVQDLYSLGIAETGAGGPAVQRFVTSVERWALRRASHVVVIHERFREHVVNVLAIPGDRVTVRRNWTHLTGPTGVDRHAVRRTLGWGAGETVVLHAGNQGAKQGLENVVAAAGLADERGAPVRFVLLGDGNQRAKLEREATGLRRIEFVDPLPDAEYQAAMAAADVLLVNELAGVAGMAVPSKLTSYYTTGRPVLAATSSESVTAAEVRAAGAGMVVPPEDPAALLDSVLALRDDPEHAETLGAAGPAFVKNVLSQDSAIAEFAALLAAVASEGRGGRRRRPVAT